MKIHLLDDDSVVLDAAAFLLSQAGYQPECWTDSREFLDKADLHTVGVVLLDMCMPYFDGGQVHQYLIEKESTLAVVIMTAHADIPMAVSELKKGAVDFLQKPIAFDPLQSALEMARQKSEKAFAAHIVKQNYNKLSDKEKEILHHIIDGKINKQIAELCHVSVRTVEVHRAHIAEKMQSKNLADLVAKASLL